MDTNMTRREALAAATATGAAAMVGGDLLTGGDVEEAVAGGVCLMTPELTIGPFFVEENLDREDIRATAGGGKLQDGAKLTLTLTVFDDGNDCQPIPGAKVDIWHCNALGRY